MDFFYPNPAPALLYTLIAGVVIGVLYDVLLIKRSVLKTPLPFVVAEDIAFCLSAYILLAVFVLKANFGLMRWYELACPFASFALYRMSVGHLVVKLGVAVISFAARLVRLLIRIFVLLPARLLWRILGLSFKRLFTVCGRLKKRSVSFALKRKALSGAKSGFEKELGKG